MVLGAETAYVAPPSEQAPLLAYVPPSTVEHSGFVAQLERFLGADHLKRGEERVFESSDGSRRVRCVQADSENWAHFELLDPFTGEVSEDHQVLLV